VPCLSALPALAQQPAPESNAQRTVAATRLPDVSMVTLDGRLDEAFWSTLTPAADFIQVDPANGRPATERTEVRIAYDNNALYLGVTCFDSEPDKLIGFQRRRDQGLGSDDRFMWIIDTFLDGRTGYFFEMNPSGLIADSLLGINGENRQWDGIWNGKARRSEIGWTLDKQHWGKGFATEGARRALDYAFNELDKSHVISLIHPDNKGSAAVAQRLGEKVEGQAEIMGINVLIWGIDRPGN
jgi:RimJ/RimL family protein N-acetyltransferase